MASPGDRPLFVRSRRGVGEDVVDETLRRVELAHRYADLGDVRLHYVEAGEGPLVLLLHGFPQFWYQWRHQSRRWSRPVSGLWPRHARLQPLGQTARSASIPR